MDTLHRNWAARLSLDVSNVRAFPLQFLPHLSPVSPADTGSQNRPGAREWTETIQTVAE